MQVHFVPENSNPRNSEALLVVLDSKVRDSATFEKLKDAAVRLARTRLIYGISKDDMLGVLVSGSRTTNNALAAEVDGGYQGLNIVAPMATRSLYTVKTLQDVPEGNMDSNLLNILDVCGDVLSGKASKRAIKQRAVIFTDGFCYASGFGAEQMNELQETCAIYREHDMQVDIICDCTEDEKNFLQEDLDFFADSDETDIAEVFVTCKNMKYPCLVALARSTGGVVYSLKDASGLVDMPIAKVKRAVANFRGVLNIADSLKIPVKKFSYVNQDRAVNAKKISWDASRKSREPVFVITETQRATSAEDDTPLETEEVINAYPYGPDFVLEVVDVDTYAWSMHLPRGLDALGFVPQESVDQRFFLGSVDVVVAMSESEKGCELMKNMVLAMVEEDVGLLARYVRAARGGPPVLAYLWPRVEINPETGSIQNCFLFAVDLAMREDVRYLPFAKLDDISEKATAKEKEAMDNYITAYLVDDSSSEDEDESEIEVFWPPEQCNPNLDWFNVCITHRSADDGSGNSFPSLSDWQRKMLNPRGSLSKKATELASAAVEEVSSSLPIVTRRRREKKGKKLFRALSAGLASIRDNLPQEVQNDVDEVDISNGDPSDAQNNLGNVSGNIDDTMSFVSDIAVADVGEDNPIRDFQVLVKDGKFRFAAVCMQITIRRLIRDMVDDAKAMKCMQTLRKSCVEHKSPHFFIDFLSSLLEKCERQDRTGYRTRAFFQYVGGQGMIDNTLSVIWPWRTQDDDDSESAKNFKNALDELSESIRRIALSKEAEDSSLSYTSAS